MEKGIHIQELVTKHMNEGKNMVEMSFEGQHESLPNILEVIREEDLNYNEDITARNNEELEKITKVEDETQNLRVLVVKEDELTSLESHTMIKYEVLKTIPKMAPWSDMHEKIKIEELAPMSKVKECIIQLNKEIEALMVIHK